MSRRKSPCRWASRTRSPCPRASRTRTPHPRASRTRIPRDGGVGRTSPAARVAGSTRRSAVRKARRTLPKAPQRHPHRGPPVPGGNLEPTRYRITVRGQVTKQVMSAFEGLDVEPDIERTSLVAEIRDQSHLYGVLDLVRVLGLDLVSVETRWVTPEPGDEESAR